MSAADPAAFKHALIVLAAAGIVVPLFHRLRVSPVLGFMLVGAFVGPFDLGRAVSYAPWLSAVTITEPEAIGPIGQLGVALLLFMIGLELSLERLSAAMLLLKLGAVAVLARLFGLSWATGGQAGLLLAPGGEFGFVILAIAVPDGFLPRAVADQALAVTALTMLLTPVLARFGDRLAPAARASREIDPALLVPADPSWGTTHRSHVIIAGFGRVGQTVAAMLEVHRVPYVAIDSDVDQVARLRADGKPVYYGDITRLELLRRLDLDTAQALVITMDDRRAADELVAAARAEREDLLIVARARDAGHAAQLYQVGASDAVPETVEASLQLSEAVLVNLGVPMGPVIASIHEKRAEFQARIKAMAPGVEVRPLGRRRRNAADRPGDLAR